MKLQFKTVQTALAGVAPWIERGLQTKGSLVQVPFRAHAWVAGQVPSGGHVRGDHTLMLLSFSSPSLPLSVKINKIKKKKKKPVQTRMCLQHNTTVLTSQPSCRNLKRCVGNRPPPRHSVHVDTAAVELISSQFISYFRKRSDEQRDSGGVLSLIHI